MGVSQNQGHFFRGPDKMEYSLLAYILRPPLIFEKFHRVGPKQKKEYHILAYWGPPSLGSYHIVGLFKTSDRGLGGGGVVCLGGVRIDIQGFTGFRGLGLLYVRTSQN